MVTLLVQQWRDLAWSAGISVVAIAGALVIRSTVLWLLRRLAHRKNTILGQSLLKYGERPTRWIFPLLAILAILPDLPLPPSPKLALEHITGLGLIVTTAWLAILLVHIASDFLAARYRIDVADNLAARRIQTQCQMLRRIMVILIVVITLAVMLMGRSPPA